MDFTIEELNLLTEGLDAIEKAASSADVMGEIIGGLMSKRTGEGDDNFSERASARMEEKRRARQEQQEQVILVKAKLIQLKRKAQDENVRVLLND